MDCALSLRLVRALFVGQLLHLNQLGSRAARRACRHGVLPAEVLVDIRREEGAEDGGDDHGRRHLGRGDYSRVIDGGVRRGDCQRRGHCVAGHRGDGRAGNTGTAGDPVEEHGDDAADDQGHQAPGRCRRDRPR